MSSGEKAKDLQKEIRYLTTLIQSHKKSSGAPQNSGNRKVSHHRGNTKWHGNRTMQPTSNVPPQQILTSRVSRGTGYHGNRVYRPPNTQPTESILASQGLPVYKPSVTLKHEEMSLEARSTKTQTSDLEESNKVLNRVQQPTHSLASCPVGTMQSVRLAKQSTNHGESVIHGSTADTGMVSTSTKRSKFKWKRKSLNSTIDLPPTHLANDGRPSSGCTEEEVKRPRSRSKKNTKYKWRRRSSSGSKDVSMRTPESPMIAQSKFKLTRASLLRRLSNSPSGRKEGSFRQRRLSYRKKHTPVSHRFKSAHSLSLSAKKKHTRISKNKVWTASTFTQNQDVDVSLPRPSLVGREVKTSRGNKQWVAMVNSPAGVPKRVRGGLVSLRGESFVQDKSGKKLKRLSSSRLAQVVRRRSSSVSDIVKSPSVKQFLASRAVRKSRVYAWNARHQHKATSDKYCMFYNRFGKCNHMDTCLYIHDPDKIAVCTKFLRGVCEKTDGSCPFSHKLAKEKMPVCSFFLRGVCTKDHCPYLHVSVGRDAQVCMDFARGYCPRGEECTMQHVLDCPEFLEKGECPRGKTCPLRHRKREYKTHKEKGEEKKAAPSVVKEPYAFKYARRHKRVNKNKDVSLDSLDSSLQSSSSPLFSRPSGTNLTPLDMSTDHRHSYRQSLQQV